MIYNLDEDNYLFIYDEKNNLIFINRNNKWIKRDFDHENNTIDYDTYMGR